jgi:hypothetical protein
MSRIGSHLRLKKFCSKNFEGMDERKLSDLYEEIKTFRGLESPLEEFEQRFASIKREILQGRPRHLTVCVSLWGLQFKFPEEELTKDLIEAIQANAEATTKLEDYENESHLKLKQDRNLINSLIRKRSFVSRTIVINCFNLMEAYLDGIAYDYIQSHGTSNLSNRKTNLLRDTTSASIREKLLKYPIILTGQKLWEEPNEELEAFVSIVKPFRDSLVHPSPFSAPEKFGGHNKLLLFYRVDYDTGILTLNLLVKLIKRIHQHIYRDGFNLPAWIQELETQIAEIGKKGKKGTVGIY